MLTFAYYIIVGAAHGLSSILQILLCFPEFIRSDPSVEKDVQGSVDFMLNTMQGNGNIAPAMDEVKGQNCRPESEELVHWCHGAPGQSNISFYLARHIAYTTDLPQVFFKSASHCLNLVVRNWWFNLMKFTPIVLDQSF